MNLLLECNLRLVGSGLDDDLILQQTIVQIIGPPPTQPRPLKTQ